MQNWLPTGWAGGTVQQRGWIQGISSWVSVSANAIAPESRLSWKPALLCGSSFSEKKWAESGSAERVRKPPCFELFLMLTRAASLDGDGSWLCGLATQKRGLWCDRCYSTPPRTATRTGNYTQKCPSGSRTLGWQPHASSTLLAVREVGERRANFSPSVPLPLLLLAPRCYGKDLRQFAVAFLNVSTVPRDP